MRSILAAVFVAFVTTAVAPVWGQFPADSTLPREKRPRRPSPKGTPGKPAPKTADGKPDLSGFWGYSGYTSDIARDYDVGGVPMTAEAERLFLERQANEGRDDPEARCLPTGIPRRDPYPSKIIQLPNMLVILFEGNIHSYRQIYLDGRQHPKDLDPTWYGHSIGHWEGDELVVDTVGFNGKIWLDMAGHPTSDKLHIVERYSRPNFGLLKLVITIDDPGMYKKSWDVTQLTPLMEGDIIEYICAENERDSKHLDSLKK